MRFEKKAVRAILAGKRTEFRETAGDEKHCKYRPGGVIPIYVKGRRESSGRVIVVRAVRDGDVWVVTFVLDRMAEPRLLHRDSSRGYTSSLAEALAEEGEAVEAEILEQFAKDNRKADEERRERGRAERDRLSLGQRVDLALDEARQRHEDVSHHERVMRERLRRIERRDKAA